MSKIHLLSPELISRIAAGECVERPASVVKELVENALDAGAQRVKVIVADGGRELIQVSDDGSGISAEDLPLSVAQHATSKISADEDLFNIHTMGFRGEALASIGAVSRLRIVSRTADSDVGYEIRVDGGKVSAPKPCAAPIGTTVEVRDLFYAVPARRKFLRTNQTETGHVSEQFARIALAHPGVGFSLHSGTRPIHDLPPASDRLQRIRDLYGAELADVLWEVRREASDMLVEGYVAPPQESRGSGKWEYVLVNGRYVRDRSVSHAIKEAYRSLIDPRRFPVAFVFITIDPEALDVNVHPMKTEVRWRDSNFVHSQVLGALRDKFLTSKLDHDARPATGDDQGYRARVRQALVDYFTQAKPGDEPERPRGGWSGGTSSRPVGDGAHRAVTPRLVDDRALESAEEASDAPQEVETEGVFTPLLSGPASLRVVKDDGDERTPFRAVQIHDSYIIAETEDGMMVIDQHALHERILYEGFSKRLTSRPLEAQRLLMPDVVRVPADRIEVLEAHAEMLGRLGIELNAVGPQSVAIQAFPTLLSERGVDQHAFVRDLLDILSEQGARPDADTLVHKVLDMMACKAAVKAGDPLTPPEIEALLAKREAAERTSHCPHGRPTTVHYSLRDLEKLFHR